MPERTQHTPDQPSPIDDIGASAPELLARAATDYADAQNRREQLSHEDRIHGQEPGGNH